MTFSFKRYNKITVFWAVVLKGLKFSVQLLAKQTMQTTVLPLAYSTETEI